MKEPSEIAKQTEAKIRAQVIGGTRQANWYWEDGSPQQKCVLVWIKEAIDAATADKDTGIERLTAEIAFLKSIEQGWILSSKAKEDEIDRLKIENRKRNEQIAAMAALLGKLPHVIFSITGFAWQPHSPDIVYDHCHRCAWERMKEK